MNNRKLTLGRKASKSFNDSSRWNRGTATHAYFKELKWRFKSLKAQLASESKRKDPGGKIKQGRLKAEMSRIKALVKQMYPKTHTQKIVELTR